jgi:hypothetical protein
MVSKRGTDGSELAAEQALKDLSWVFDLREPRGLHEARQLGGRRWGLGDDRLEQTVLLTLATEYAGQA